MSKYLKQDFQNMLNRYCEYVEKLKKNPSLTIGREQKITDKLNQYNIKFTKAVADFKRLEENYKLMTKEEKKEYIRRVKIARRSESTQFNKMKL